MRSPIQFLPRNTLVAVASVATAVGAASILGTEAAAQRVLSYHFVVTSNNCQFDLGSWSKATGLDVSWDLAEYRSGDKSSSFRRHLRDSFNKGTITLSRPAGSESALVQYWLAQLAQSPDSATVDVALIDNIGQPVTSWELTGVLPLNWTISAADCGRFGCACF